MASNADDTVRRRRGQYSAVLLVDHELTLDGLRSALEGDGWAVTGAFTDPQRAIQQIAHRAPDVVVIDLRLGERSEQTVLKALKGLGKKTSPVILADTADPDAAAEALRGGARGFLLKDSPTSELVSRLRAAADGYSIIDGRVASALTARGAQENPLTEQEITILDAVARGMTNRQIGAEMFLSHYTVKEHLAKVMRKLGTHRRAETVARASELGLLTDPEYAETSQTR